MVEKVVEIVKKAVEVGETFPQQEFPKLPERELEYDEGAYGITEILGCPLKAKIRRQLEKEGVELPIESLEISDGFLWENQVKVAVKSLYPEAELEKDLKGTIETPAGTLKIHGHLDVYVEGIGGLELKSTVMTVCKVDTPDYVMIAENESDKRFFISDKYVKQAKIQKYLLEKTCGREIPVYLIIKTLFKGFKRQRKGILIVPITTAITEEELKEIATLFLTSETPRESWECRYCSYREYGYCSGKRTEREKKEIEELGELFDLLERREELLRELREVEERIKREVKTSGRRTISYNGKEVGYRVKVRRIVDNGKFYDWVKENKESLKQHGYSLKDLISVNYRKLSELEEIYGELPFITKKTQEEWKW